MDYIWVELMSEDPVVAELEIEKEKESEEEVRESETKETKLDLTQDHSLHLSNDTQQINLYSGFVKHGNSFEQLARNLEPSLFIRFHRLKIHC